MEHEPPEFERLGELIVDAKLDPSRLVRVVGAKKDACSVALCYTHDVELIPS